MRVEGRDGEHEDTQYAAMLVCLPTGDGYCTLSGNKKVFKKKKQKHTSVYGDHSTAEYTSNNKGREYDPKSA